MALEVGNYITDLVPANPEGTDQISHADDHMRLIKKCVQQSFPSVDAPVNATPADLNAYIPIGGIIMYNGTVANIPASWQLCDGTNGTPNLVDRFVYGTVTEGEIGDAGGNADAVVVQHNHTGTIDDSGAHSHTGSTDSAGSHTHSIPVTTGQGDLTGTASDAVNGPGNTGSAGSHTHSFTTSGQAAHSHTFTINNAGESGVGKNIPPYIKLAYIQRMS